MASTLPITPLHFSVGTICLGGSVAGAPIEVTRCYGLQRPNGPNILLSIAIERLGQTSRKGASVFLDYFALGVLVFAGVTLFYAVIAIHDIPHLMAKARNHPLMAQGQLQPDGALIDPPSPERIAPGQTLARIELLENTDAYQLPGGVVAEVAVYTHHRHHVAILRKVLLRMSAWMNYVFLEH